MSDAVLIAWIGLGTTVLTAIISSVTAIVVLRISRSTDRYGEQIVLVEKNTNHIREELVKVTAKEAHARGLKEGKEESKK